MFADLPKLQSEQLVIKFVRSFTSSYSTPSIVCGSVNEPNLARQDAWEITWSTCSLTSGEERPQ